MARIVVADAENTLRQGWQRYYGASVTPEVCTVVESTAVVFSGRADGWRHCEPMQP